MITTQNELREYILQDAKANKRKRLAPKLWGDFLWKYIVTMRKLDYYSNHKNEPYGYVLWVLNKVRYRSLSIKLGFTIPFDKCGKGLALPHYGCIVVNGSATIGDNCKILDCVNIGATNGSAKAPRIGNNVFIGSGAKVIGDIDIADNVAIGANAVVVKSITEPGTTWAGVPARKISNENSKKNLSQELFV